ncbi:MAG: M43 family zinc metalloprotease [Bacteroidota bacterium]
MKKWILLISMTTSSFLLFSQEKLENGNYFYKCAIDELVKMNLNNNPDLATEYLIHEKNIREIIQQFENNPDYLKSKNNRTDTLINGRRIIPVVFHVIHKGGEENISKDQILDAVNLLNKDYNKLNPDTASTASVFLSRAANCQIEFRLAKIDPDGNCTDGIHRVYDPRTDYAQYNVMSDNSWPYSKYMNIYVVNYIYPEGMTLPDGALIGGLSPFTPDNTLSGTNGDTLLDGVLIRHDCVGSIGTAEAFAGIQNYNNRNRVLTHESGHFFNLYHPFQDIIALLLGGDGCGYFGITTGDEVSDTPPVAEATQGCPPLDQNTCTSDSPDMPDMVQNYMDYAAGWCQNIFTNGQLDRINTTLSGTRRNLWSFENLVSTGVLDTSAQICPPVADFYQNVYMICEGEIVNFSDWSFNGEADAWKWIFPGGYPAISNQQNPTVIYYAEGDYDVTFIAMNANGVDTLIKTATVHVYAHEPGSDLSYVEDFETGAFNSLWMFNNEDGNTWEVTDSASSSGTFCMMLRNYENNARFSYDELITEPIDLTQISGVLPCIKFDLSYAGRREITGVPFLIENDTTDQYDLFQVFASTNCGKTWTVRYSKTDSVLATAGIFENSFLPTSPDQWRQISVSLSGLTLQNNVRFKFKFTSKGGNNIFIDNINIETNLSVEDAYFSDFDFSVIPNPANDYSNIIFDLPKAYNTKIKITDVLGKHISTLCDADLLHGSYRYRFDTESLNQGIYFINISLDGMKYSKKLIVNK